MISDGLDKIIEGFKDLNNDPPVWVDRPGPQPGNLTVPTVSQRIGLLTMQLAVYTDYCKVCDQRNDRHGVIDAQCEMRELEARIDELERLLK